MHTYFPLLACNIKSIFNYSLTHERTVELKRKQLKITKQIHQKSKQTESFDARTLRKRLSSKSRRTLICILKPKTGARNEESVITEAERQRFRPVLFAERL
jgi:hypothetical protein